MMSCANISILDAWQGQGSVFARQRVQEGLCPFVFRRDQYDAYHGPDGGALTDMLRGGRCSSHNAVARENSHDVAVKSVLVGQAGE